MHTETRPLHAFLTRPLHTFLLSPPPSPPLLTRSLIARAHRDRNYTMGWAGGLSTPPPHPQRGEKWCNSLRQKGGSIGRDDRERGHGAPQILCVYVDPFLVDSSLLGGSLMSPGQATAQVMAAATSAAGKAVLAEDVGGTLTEVTSETFIDTTNTVSQELALVGGDPIEIIVDLQQALFGSYAQVQAERARRNQSPRRQYEEKLGQQSKMTSQPCSMDHKHSDGAHDKLLSSGHPNDRSFLNSLCKPQIVIHFGKSYFEISTLEELDKVIQGARTGSFAADADKTIIAFLQGSRWIRKEDIFSLTTTRCGPSLVTLVLRERGGGYTEDDLKSILQHFGNREVLSQACTQLLELQCLLVKRPDQNAASERWRSVVNSLQILSEDKVCTALNHAVRAEQAIFDSLTASLACPSIITDMNHNQNVRSDTAVFQPVADSVPMSNTNSSGTQEIDTVFPMKKRPRLSGSRSKGESDLDGHRILQESAAMRLQSVYPHVWVRFVESAESIPVAFEDTNLGMVRSIKSLCEAINRALQSVGNKHSAACLHLLNCDNGLDPVVIVEMHPPFKVIQRKCDTDTWKYSVSGMIGKAHQNPILISKAEDFTSKFERHSEKCFEIFQDNGLLEKCRESSMSLSMLFGWTAETRRQQSGRGMVQLRKGISVHPCAEMSKKPVDSAGLAREISLPWPSQFCPSDLGLEMEECQTDFTNILPRRRISFAQSCVVLFFQHRDCIKFRHSTEGKKRQIDGVCVFPYVRICCPFNDNHKQKCKFYARYKYLDPPHPGWFHHRNSCEKMFLLKKSHSVHTCQPDCHSGNSRFQTGIRGKCLWPTKCLEQARAMELLKVSLPEIVAGFGFLRGTTAFSAVTKQLYDHLRRSRVKSVHASYQKLLDYLCNGLENGRFAFVSLQGLDGFSGLKPRFYLTLAQQLALPKLQFVSGFAIDFLYSLIDGMDVAYGMFSLRGPSGLLVTLAIFFIEKENQDGIQWITDKLLRSYQIYGIKMRPMVLFFLVLNLLSRGGNDMFCTDCIS